MDCAALDLIFENLNANGTYSVTVVSNQPDGIAGFGALLMRSDAAEPQTLKGAAERYLFSDRAVPSASQDPSISRPDQPFGLAGGEPVTASITRQTPGRYRLQIKFTGAINRAFDFEGQCMGAAIVGTAPAIGNSEGVDTAVYVVTTGRFTPLPK